MSLPTIYQEFIHKSRYARFLESEGRRENWAETVGRYFDFMTGHLEKQTGYKLPKVLRSELEDAVLNLSVLPSMRAMMTAGPALELENLAGFNCSYVPMDHPNSFGEVLYILMCGVGVGFSAERQCLNKLPAIPASLSKNHNVVVVVGDSKGGWSSAYQELINHLYSGTVPKWDVSQVRPAGAPLKTFGGRASGPGPLVDLFEFTAAKFVNSRGRKLTSVEVHDIATKIGEVVVVGGVRRSAMISLSNLSDDRMRHAKSGQWWETEPQRALANNSVAYTERPEVGAFMTEWLALYDSKSGERGIFNRQAVDNRIAKYGRRQTGHEWGPNPCVTGDTRILTKTGYRQIGTLVGETVEVWNGERWSQVTPFSTGVNELVQISLSNGVVLNCTPNHKFLVHSNHSAADVPGGESQRTSTRTGKPIWQIRTAAVYLKPGDRLAKYEFPVVEHGEDPAVDAYSQGFYSGDGFTNGSSSRLYRPKFSCQDRLVGSFGEVVVSDRAGRTEDSDFIQWRHGPMLEKNFVPTQATLQYRLDWLAGLADSDGCVANDVNGQGIQICSTDRNFLNEVRLMLTTCGVDTKVVFAGEGKLWGEYQCQDGWRLLIGNMQTYDLIQLGLKTNRLNLHGRKPQRSSSRYITVLEVTPIDEPEETFCFTEEEFHRGVFEGVITGQCGEVNLRPHQLCNLSETVIRADDTLAVLKEKLRFATILGTFQSTLTNFSSTHLRDIWRKNTEEERLLGVSLTGIFDSALTNGHQEGLAERLREMREYVVEVNAEFAKKLKIPQSAACTTVKPSGTVSQLVDSASGIHARHSAHYIRTVRADNRDPLTQFLKDMGVPAEQCVMKPESTTIFSFPIKSPEDAITRNDLTAIEHLNLVKTYTDNWTEHNASTTIYVKEREWPEVGAWVWNNFDEIGGISFLPHSEHSYRQAPYQDCTEEEYKAALYDMPQKLDWDYLAQLEGGEDRTTGAQELACTSGACELL